MTYHSYSVVLKFFNRCNEQFYSEIVDSPSRSGASRKANYYLGETFFTPVKKVRIDNYEHWFCYDIADIGKLE